jgi:transposase InsO family protein
VSDNKRVNTWQAEVRVNNKPLKFRLDTGADATVLPAVTYNRLFRDPLSPADKLLCGPNRAQLDVLGRFDAQLQWRDRRTKHTIYVVRDIHQPLLGRDAIDTLGMAVCLNALSSSNDPRQQYADLFTGLGCMEGEYTIRLKPDAQPFAVFTPRRVPVNLLAPLKQELQKLQQAGVIRRVDEPTPWCAPIVVIPKKTSGIRLCVDMTRLNEAVLREQYTLPVIDQLLARLAGATVYSKLDCNQGFHQIPLSSESQLLTTFTTPFGRWCYTRLPFGISSAVEVFSKRMGEILESQENALCLVDDVLVFGKDQAEHDARLREVLDRFRRAKVTLNEKCEFSKNQIKWAGHVISGDGISMDPDRLSAILNMPPPTDVSAARCFLGMANQMAKFSSSLAELSAPIRDLLRKDRAWVWDSAQQSAFEKVKKAIASAPVLALYDPNKPTLVSADSSSYGIGAVLLQQQSDGTWRPVTFVSRALNDVEKRYAQVEKECLALTYSAERLSDYLIGTKFVLQTDHKPLVSLLSPQRALDDIPPRIQRMRIRLMRFNYTVEYLPGNQLYTADTLSRFPLPAEPALIDTSDVVEQYISFVVDTLPITDVMIDKVLSASAADDNFQRVITFCNTEWPDDVELLPSDVRPFWHSRDQLTVQNGLLLYNARIVIPASLRQTTLEALHSGHLGVEKCRSKARTAVWWPKIGADIAQYVASCQTCLHWAKDHAEPLQSTPLPELPWQKVATDLFELDNKHYLVVVDYYSRYVELVQLRHQTADDVINALKAIFARHGVPMVCFSDNGPCYSASAFQSFATSYGFIHQTSSPRFAQSNGAAERAVQTMKALLRKSADPYLALLSYRTTPLNNGYSPAQLLMGRQLRSTVPTTTVQLQPHTPDAAALQSSDRTYKQQQATYYNRRHRTRDRGRWKTSDRVWIPDLQTEATVVDVLPFRSYQLRTTAGNIIRRNGRALRHPLPTPPPTTTIDASPTTPPVNNRCRVREGRPPQELPPPQRQQRQRQGPASTGATRSGRVIRRPDRLDL